MCNLGDLVLDDIFASHAVSVFSKLALWITARSGNPQEVWGSLYSAWIGVANGNKKFGRIFFRSVESSSDFKVWVGVCGSLSVVTALRVEFTIAWWRLIAFRESSFPLRFNSVRKPSSRPGGLRPFR